MITQRFNVPTEWRIHSHYNFYYKGFLDMVNELPSYFQPHSLPVTMIEIGSYMGESTMMFASIGLFKTIHSIDPHQGTEEFNELFGYSWGDVEKEYKLTQDKKHEILLNPIFFENKKLKKDYLKLELNNRKQREEVNSLILKNNKNASINDKDYVFITFIINHLPNGIIGLLLAVIFAAAMSSTASELNALSATTLIDLYKRHTPNLSANHYVNMAKLFTLMWGVIAIIFASFGNLFENLIQLVNIIGSIFYGTILGVFLVAIFFKKIESNPVFYAAIISELIVVSCYLVDLYLFDLFGYLWLNVIGSILTISFAYLLQKIKI